MRRSCWIELLSGWLMWFICVACEDEQPVMAGGGTDVSEYRVVVVMPGENQEHWKRVAEWAMDDLSEAQRNLPQQVKLKLEWKDENAPDLEEYLTEVASNPEVVAVVGPYHSHSAQVASICCGAQRKTLILPVVSSVELQRSCAGKDFLWALAESDIGQCEVMLTQAMMNEAENVYLLSREDDYGQGFIDWFAFQATELGLAPQGNYVYSTPEEMTEALNQISHRAEELHDDVFQTLLFVPSSAEDVVWLDSIYRTNVRLHPHFPEIMCSDVAYSHDVQGRLVSGLDWEGVSLSADPSSGFSTIYRVKFGEEPLNGDAHFYDAFTLLAYGLTVMKQHPDMDLNEALKRLVDGRTAYSGSWMRDDMRQTFSMLASGMSPDVKGVTGSWDFDAEKYTSVLHSTYAHWTYVEEEGFYVWNYLSTDGDRRTSSTLANWNWAVSNMDVFNMNASDLIYPAWESNWCVLVAASEGWVNYRHQADVYAMYQLAKRHGYDDDHIILIAADDIAYDARNLYPGVVRVRPDGENVYEGVHIDYDLNDLKPEDFVSILSGVPADRTPIVVEGDEHANVFVFWSGHGTFGRLNWGDGYESLSRTQLREVLQAASDRRNYRKMFIGLETCYSGSVASGCEGIPGVLFMTAANEYETSKADVQDYEMNIWLSNGFTRAFQETIDMSPDISLRDLYYQLARHTVGSHVSVYNEENYGNVYHNTMAEYLMP